ncbi:MAG: iron-sulfur cluster assembly scaffold protein [bacterium]
MKVENMKYFGNMDNPTSWAYVQGPCGDNMKFYLLIDNGIIKDVKFNTDGCTFTVACGAMTAHLVLGKSINEALGISSGQVMNELDGLPKEHIHCSILAVTTLYRAIADYLLR